MIWAIILDYQIKGISVEELSAKEGLLLWCQRKTAGYRDVKVENFSNSWVDGLAFCALIHKHRPDLLDFDSLSKNNARENLELAFSVAEKHLGIPRLLDVEDLVDVAKPDERSIVTQVSEYFHCFSAQDQVEVAGRRIAKWIALAKSHETLKQEFEHNVESLLNWIKKKTSEIEEREYDNTLNGIQSKWEDFKQYKKTEKPAKTNEKLEVETAYNTLQALLRVNNRPPYVPPEQYSLSALEDAWKKLGGEEVKRSEWLRKELERQQRLEILASRFWRKAKALLQWGDDNKSLLTSTDNGSSVADVEAKLKNLTAFEETFKDAQKRLDNTKQLGHELVSQGYGKANEVTSKISELDNLWSDLNNNLETRKQVLQRELEHQNKLEQLRLQFATRSRALVSWIDDAEDGEIAEPVTATSLESIEQLESSFSTFKSESDNKANEYNSVVELSQTLTNEGITSNVYATFTVEQVTERWNRLQSEINEREQSLKVEHARIQENDELLRNFAEQAKNFLGWVEEQKEAVTKGTEGSINDQLSALQSRGSEISVHKSTLEEVVSLSSSIEERNVTHNPYSQETAESLTAAYESLSQLVSKQTALLEKELLNQTGSKVSEDQLAEFRETFKNFDKDNNGVLEAHEFKACCTYLFKNNNNNNIILILIFILVSALGHNVGNDEAVAKLVNQLAQSVPNKITFQEFVDYMISRTEDSDSPTVIKNAFRMVAGNKDFVTTEDLKRVPSLSEDTLNFLSSTMAQSGNGYDYSAFVDGQYRS